MHIKVLGPGCQNCITLHRIVIEAMTELGVSADVTKVEDFPTIVSYGVMSTPALVIEEQVVVSGRVPTPTQVREILQSAVGAQAAGK